MRKRERAQERARTKRGSNFLSTELMNSFLAIFERGVRVAEAVDALAGALAVRDEGAHVGPVGRHHAARRDLRRGGAAARVGRVCVGGDVVVCGGGGGAEQAAEGEKGEAEAEAEGEGEKGTRPCDHRLLFAAF